MTRLFFFILFAQGCAFAQNPQVSTYLPLRHVIVGEEALLNIQISGEQPTGSLSSAKTTQLQFSRIEPDIINRQIFCANIGMASRKPGSFEIPKFKVPLKNGNVTTEPATLEAFPLHKIQWQELSINERTYRIGTTILFPSGPIYEGQTVPLTAKIFIPSSLPVRSNGYVEIEKENIGAWRLEPPYPPNYLNASVHPRPPNALRPRVIRIQGRKYEVVNFVTFAAPLKAGNVTVGPGRIRELQVLLSRTNQRSGFFSSFSQSYGLDLEIPAVRFQALPLPKGAPAEFSGAIGNFTLTTSIDSTADLKPGDPVIVTLQLKGNGNLDTLPSPQLDAPASNWKLYPPTRNESQDNRRSDQGTVAFSQILRPLVPIKEIPSFRFSFFNPTTKAYETLRSDPIPLSLAPLTNSSTSAPVAGLIPIAEMQDILGLITPKPFSPKESPKLWPHWQLLSAFLALLLLGLIAKKHLPKFSLKKTKKKPLSAKLNDIKNSSSDLLFLKNAASFAERENLETDDFVTGLITERDNSCYQTENESLTLSPSRKGEILKELQARISVLLLATGVLLTCQLSEAQAFHNEAQLAWEKSDFQVALDAYQLSLQDEETPDLHFNIANCYYRLNDIGQAAIHYHRALRLMPHHPESRQNLAFLERKLGAIPTPEKAIPRWARQLTLPITQNILRLTLWLLLIAILTYFTFSRPVFRKASLTGITIALIGFFLFGIISFFHPDRAPDLTPPNALIVAQEATEVRTEPSAGGSVILNVNPTTTCRILTNRGNWTYIELPNSTRGWVRNHALKKI